MDTLGSSIWVRLHTFAALMWLGVAGYEIFSYSGSLQAQIKLAAAALGGAVVIIAIGLCIQLAVNRVSRMRR